MENTQIVIQKPGNVSVLQTVRSTVPKLLPHQILINNEAAGVGFADILMREGLYPNVPKRGVTPGYDVVGRVHQTGGQVTGVNVGDRVVALTQTGGYAAFTVADQALVVPCPDHLPADKAVSLVLNYTTAYQMLTRVAKVQPGQSVLIHGVAGGVGSALLELALQMNLKVYGTLSERKWKAIPVALDQHLDFTKIDYQAAPFEQTLERLAPQGIDAVFDPIGGNHLKRSYRCMKPGGTVVSYGFSTAISNGRRNWIAACKGYLESTFFAVQLLEDSKIVAGYGIWTFAQANPDLFREDLTTLLRLLEDEKIDPLIAGSWPLSQAQDAQKIVESSGLAGKVVIDMSL